MTRPVLQTSIDARGVARVVLDRPDVHNAFDEASIERLTRAFESLGRDPAVRVIVLASTGRTFCAGADIAWMRRAAASDEAANLADARAFADMMSTIAHGSKPVIARIQGAAYGGGVGLACAVDIAIAAESARFCVSEARLGILPAVIGPYLVNAVGRREAVRLAMTTTTVGAREAMVLGLVSQVVADDGLDAAVDQAVDALLASGPAALSEIKHLFRQLSVGPVDAAVRDMTASVISRVRGTAEAREGFAAFTEKRPPRWKPD